MDREPFWAEQARTRHERETVLRACDGTRTPDEIAHATGLDRFRVRLILRRLARAGDLEA
ncbi:MAG: hypothetical protein RID81_07100 [Sandaracinaceae bacterium]